MLRLNIDIPRHWQRTGCDHDGGGIGFNLKQVQRAKCNRRRMQNQFTDVTRLAQGLVLNNYNSLQYGEPDLQNALSHNISLLYSSFNLFNYTNVFARKTNPDELIKYEFTEQLKVLKRKLSHPKESDEKSIQKNYNSNN